MKDLIDFFQSLVNLNSFKSIDLVFNSTHLKDFSKLIRMTPVGNKILYSGVPITAWKCSNTELFLVRIFKIGKFTQCIDDHVKIFIPLRSYKPHAKKRLQHNSAQIKPVYHVLNKILINGFKICRIDVGALQLDVEILNNLFSSKCFHFRLYFSQWMQSMTTQCLQFKGSSDQ